MTTGHSASATGGSDAASSDGSAGDNPDAPLKGLRVIEFGQYIDVPAAGQLLADLGADVVKVESSDGDASRKLGWSSDDCGPVVHDGRCGPSGPSPAGTGRTQGPSAGQLGR